MPNLLVLAGILLLVTLLAWWAPHRPEGDNEQWAHLISTAGFAALIGSNLLLRMRGQMSTALRYAFWWLLIGFTVVAGYSYRHELGGVFSRVSGELNPSRPQIAADGEMSLRRAADGHFHLMAEVNGVGVAFLIDTGATDIVLTRIDARRVGLNPDGLTYNRPYQTANGMVFGASVRLDSLHAGPLEMHDVPASVNGGELSTSLLGMRFLNAFGAYEVRGDVLTLVP